MRHIMAKRSIISMTIMSILLYSCFMDGINSEAEIEEALKVVGAAIEDSTTASRATSNEAPVIVENPANTYKYTLVENELYINIGYNNFTSVCDGTSYLMDGSINLILPIEGQSYMRMKTDEGTPITINGGNLSGSLEIDVTCNYSEDGSTTTTTGTINGQTYTETTLR